MASPGDGDIGHRVRQAVSGSGTATIVAVPAAVVVAVAVALLVRALSPGAVVSPNPLASVGRGESSLMFKATVGSPRTGSSAVLPAQTPSKSLRLAKAGSNLAAVRRASRSDQVSSWDPGSGSSAQHPGIRAEIQVRRTGSDCPSLATAVPRGGLEGAIASAVANAERQSLTRGASAAETEMLLQRAVQSVLIASGAAPKDVLRVLVDLERAYTDCNGDRVTVGALNSLGAVVRAQLNYSQPAATGGPGSAPLGDPTVPVPGGLGAAGYLQRLSG